MKKPFDESLSTERSVAEPSRGEILVYQNETGQVKLEVRLQDENVWLTQQMMADLFLTTQQNVSQHILNIYEEGELEENPTHKVFLLVRREGSRDVKRRLDYYNLDMIISVGYRIKSRIATRFRMWATQKIREYLIKGFVMDDERLKNPPLPDSPVPDYFDEMLARIRDIRASERRMYLRVKEIFAMAADYEPTQTETAKFFSIIQNKLHYAATGLTAAELVHSRANHLLPNMGLTSWKADEIRKSDVTVAKNYLDEREIDELNRIVVMWLDYAEDQAKRRKQVFMSDWAQKLDDFLTFNDRNVLPNAGSVSHDSAESHAKSEYDLYAEKRREEKEMSAFIENIRDLENAAKILPGSSNKKRIAHQKKNVKDDGND